MSFWVFFLFCITAVSAVTVDFGYFLHLTDIHYDPFYREGAPTNCVLGVMGCCRNESIPLDPPGKANKFGEYVCDSSPLLVQSILGWIKENLEYDYVIYTGDSVSHYDIRQNWNMNYDVIHTVTEMLQTLDKPVYSVLGNHDSQFVDQLYGLDPVVTDVGGLWENDLFTNNASIRNFTQGGYYKSGHICGLNSLWYDPNNLLLVLNGSYDWFGQYAWGIKSVEDCFLISHIYATAGDLAFQSFLQAVKPRYQFYGHSHKDQFLVFNNFVSWVTLSVVPDGHDPGVRVFQYDRNTNEILDYMQYTLNLTRQQSSDTFIGLELSYSARKEYGLRDMSSESWWDLALRMKNDSVLLERYCSHLGGRVNDCHGALCDINPVLCE
jgi:hypothetical protein